MSTSGRYQSRVLSFFSRQSLRLRDQAGQALRRLKMAAVLGAQIVLYPVYVAFQTGRLIDRQIQQAAQRILPQLQAARHRAQQKNQPHSSAAIEADTPIQKTLQAVQNLQLLLPSHQVTLDPLEGTLDSFSANALVLAAQHEQLGIAVIGLKDAISLLEPGLKPGLEPASTAIAPPTALAPATISPAELTSASTQMPANLPANTLLVQGIASMLTTHHLVLVTHCNEVLDILTLEQQSQLQKYIVWEVANYWRQHRQFGGIPPAELAAEPRSNTFLPLPKIRPTQLPPIRFFRQLMTWMQISPVAIAANLFQESQLVPLLESRTLPLDQLPVQFLPVGYLPSADNPVEGTEWRSKELQQLWQSLTSSISPESMQNELPDFTLRSLSTAQPLFWQWLQTKAQQIKQLPEKLATDMLEKTGLIYSPGNLPVEFTASSPELNPAQPHPSNFNPSGSNPINSNPIGSNPIGSNQADWLTMEDLFGGIPIQTRRSTANPPQPKASNQKSIHNPQSTIHNSTASRAPLSVVAPVETDSTSPTFTPPWIEAEVKLVQYEKHPLEQLLQWLDSGMVWLEAKLTQAWQWFRDRL